MSFSIEDPRKWLDLIPGTLKASPLYLELWEHIKDDEEILALVNQVDKNQPNLVTFFVGVHFLLLREPHHPLGLYYPYFQKGDAPPLSEVYPYFREFVLLHLAELQTLLPTARLQTNEVARCANLLPAFVLAYQRGGQQPLNMIEIGSSCGLNLLWDRYRYHYRSDLALEDISIGDLSSPVQIHCQLDGPLLPLLPGTILPRVASIQGIELFLRDIHDEEDMRWVRASIWPEELERHQVLDAAIRFARQEGLHVHHGDGCELLPGLLAAIPEAQTAVVWHSFAINQGPIEVKKSIDLQIAEASRRMPIYRVALELSLENLAGSQLELYEYRDGMLVKQELLAHCAVHGKRMTWLSA
jgi:hypothetical protein